MSEYLPVVYLLFFGIGLGAAILGISAWLGPNRAKGAKAMPYECGFDPYLDTGQDARRRFDVKFYIVAMLFILFDIEIVFLYPWATLFRELGLFGFVEMMVFIFILLLGLAYVWKKGALEWD